LWRGTAQAALLLLVVQQLLLVVVVLVRGTWVAVAVHLLLL
jgi:hypothetical protein